MKKVFKLMRLEIMLLACTVIILNGCNNSVISVEGEVFTEYKTEDDKKKLLINTKTDGRLIRKFNDKIVKIFPQTKSEFFEDGSFILESGIIVVSEKNWKSVKEIEVKKFLEPKWGRCQFIRLKIPADLEVDRIMVELKYLIPGEKDFSINKEGYHLFDYENKRYFGFFIPFNVFQKPEKVKVKANIHSNNDLAAECHIIQEIFPFEFETQNIYFKKSKSGELKSTSKNKYREEHKIRKKIWAENNPDHYFFNGIKMPLENTSRLTSDFGLKREWILSSGKVYSRSVHLGVDFGIRSGTDIFAPGDGIVRYAQEGAYVGKTVILEHGFSFFTDYSHMSKIIVEPGQKIRKGEKIGEAGMTGAATGPHLHWGARVDGLPVDPRAFIGIDKIFIP